MKTRRKARTKLRDIRKGENRKRTDTHATRTRLRQRKNSENEGESDKKRREQTRREEDKAIEREEGETDMRTRERWSEDGNEEAMTEWMTGEDRLMWQIKKMRGGTKGGGMGRDDGGQLKGLAMRKEWKGRVE